MKDLMVNKNDAVRNYQPSPKSYPDVEGRLVEKKGRDLKLEKTLDGRKFQYRIRTKEEVKEEVGSQLVVDRDNIQSLELEEKKELRGEDLRSRDKILRDLGLASSQENIAMIENLLRLGIKISQGNVRSYIQAKENLARIEEGFSLDKLIRSLDQGLDLEELNLDRLADLLEEEPRPRIFARPMTYREAEARAQEIYGQKMGRDVYDIIIALDRQGLDLDRLTIDRSLELMGKIYGLEDLEDRQLIRAWQDQEDFTINNLYRISRDYKLSGLEENQLAGVFERQTIREDISHKSLLRLMEDLDLPLDQENISLAREFLLLGLNLDKTSQEEVMAMKASLRKVLDLIQEDDLVRLVDKNIDLGNQDLGRLAEALENQDLDSLREDLIKIEDRDLIRLVREKKPLDLARLDEIIRTPMERGQGEDFQCLDLAERLVDSFRRLEEFFPRQDMLLEATTSLDDLLLSCDQGQVEARLMMNKQARRDFSRSEYLKFRDSLDTRIIQQALVDSRDLFKEPIRRLNSYIDRSLDSYRQSMKMKEDLDRILARQDEILPLVLRNKMDMKLGNLARISSYLEGEESLARLIEKKPGLREELRENLDQASREGYLNILEGLDLAGGSSSGYKKYRDLEQDLNKEDLVFQLPLELGGELRDINIIVPNRRTIKKDRLDFYLSLKRGDGSILQLDLALRGRELYMGAGQLDKDLDWSQLEESLAQLGYSLRLGDRLD